MCLMTKVLFKLMIQLKGLTCHAMSSDIASDIAMAHFDNRAENYTLKCPVWKRFRDGVFSVWAHNINTLPAFPDYLNNIDSTGKIKFTMQCADKNGLEFLDLKFKMNQNSKTTIDVFLKTYQQIYLARFPNCQELRLDK